MRKYRIFRITNYKPPYQNGTGEGDTAAEALEAHANSSPGVRSIYNEHHGALYFVCAYGNPQLHDAGLFQCNVPPPTPPPPPQLLAIPVGPGDLS